jgi:porphobilinogen synthase
MKPLARPVPQHREPEGRTREEPPPQGEAGRFPSVRMRRNRKSAWSRRLMAENMLTPADLIWPIFVTEGRSRRLAVQSMPGVDRLSVDLVAEAAEEAVALGIPAIALFPYTDTKLRSEDGAEAFNPDNLVCQATRAVRKAGLDIGVLLDVALDPYTSHGHDGLMRDGEIRNDETLEALVRQTLVQAQAGCDIIAPSDMMDGRVGVIRKALEDAGHQNVQIMAYAAKYASAFYGPFREAAQSAPKFGDRRSHQMDPANAREAIREVLLDIEEGADLVMVKPALPYLDVIYRVRQAVNVPVAAYHVSGEYAMLAAAASRGWIDRERVMLESLHAIRRAGADLIVTYFAKEAARLLAR